MKKNKDKFKPEKELRETKKVSATKKKFTKNKAYDLDDFESYDEMMDFNNSAQKKQS